jgi:hypothetical protein
MPRTIIDPTIAPANEAHIAHEASRVLEAHPAGAKLSVRVQLVEAGQEVTTLEMPPSAPAPPPTDAGDDLDPPEVLRVKRKVNLWSNRSRFMRTESGQLQCPRTGGSGAALTANAAN